MDLDSSSAARRHIDLHLGLPPGPALSQKLRCQPAGTTYGLVDQRLGRGVHGRQPSLGGRKYLLPGLPSSRHHHGISDFLRLGRDPHRYAVQGFHRSDSLARLLSTAVADDHGMDLTLGSLQWADQQVLDESFRARAASFRHLFVLGNRLVPCGFQHFRAIPFDDTGLHGYGCCARGCSAHVRQQQLGSLDAHYRAGFGPAILASTALGFIRSLESLEVEMVLGIPAGIYVVPTKIWDYIHWEPPLYDRATALCSIFLLFIFFLIWLHRIFLRGRQFTTITGRSYMVRTFPLGRWRWVTCAVSLLFIAVMIILPLATLIMGTFMEFFGNFTTEKVWTARHWIAVFTDPVFLRSLKNTLVLGAGAGIVGTLLYALISYLIVRTRLSGRGVIDILSWLPWALPGVLISLALLWAVLGSGEYVKLIYGTVSVLILAIIIKEMPLGTQIIKAGVLQISNELEEASSAAGASWLGGFRRISAAALEADHDGCGKKAPTNETIGRV